MFSNSQFVKLEIKGLIREMQSESINNQPLESGSSSRLLQNPVASGNPFISCFLQDYSRDVRQELDASVDRPRELNTASAGKMMLDKRFGAIAISTPVKHAGCI